MGKTGRPRLLATALQLREKQKAKRIYFTLEGPVSQLLREGRAYAWRDRASLLLQTTGAAFGQRLCSASDLRNRGVRRGSWCATDTSAVNNRKVNIPSYEVSAGEGDRHPREQQGNWSILEMAKEFASHGTLPKLAGK